MVRIFLHIIITKPILGINQKVIYRKNTASFSRTLLIFYDISLFSQHIPQVQSNEKCISQNNSRLCAMPTKRYGFQFGKGCGWLLSDRKHL